MNLDEVKAFLAVVEAGSFAGAAQSLDFARTTLRRHIEELEERVGSPLLERATQGVKLTRAGELLAERGRAMLAEAQGLLDAARALRDTRPTIVLEVPRGLPPSMEAATHRTLRRAAPFLHWKIRYTSGRHDPESEALLVIHSTSPVPNERWRSQRLGALPVRLLATERYLKRHGLPNGVEDLGKHSLMMWDQPDRPDRELPLLGGGSVAVDPTLITPNFHLIRLLAASSDGIGFAPAVFLTRGGEDEKLVRVLDDVIGSDAELWCSVRRQETDGPLSALADAVVGIVMATISRLKRN